MKKTQAGTCPVCNSKCRVFIPRGNTAGMARVCGKHYLYFGSVRETCKGHLRVCKEDGPDK